MADEGFERKLTAILSADVESCSRLMDDDEEATVRTLTAYRTVLSDIVQQYGGRVVDSPGDNILAEFKSVVDAVNCAVAIQRELAKRNIELPENRKMQFRIRFFAMEEKMELAGSVVLEGNVPCIRWERATSAPGAVSDWSLHRKPQGSNWAFGDLRLGRPWCSRLKNWGEETAGCRRSSDVPTTPALYPVGSRKSCSSAIRGPPLDSTGAKCSALELNN